MTSLPPRRLLIATMIFGAMMAFAVSPNIVHIYGIHNDYEMLAKKSHGFFHPEADQLLSIARPLPALLTNLTIMPLQSLPDWRWVRIFSLLTVWVAGAQMIYLCAVRLQTGIARAVAVAAATFLGLPFIYSILQPAAWAPHLLTTLLAFSAYAILSRTNAAALAFLPTVENRDYAALPRQILGYCHDRRILGASLLFQAALYSYPPNALILALMPVVGVLFSRSPQFFRTLVAVRDIVFLFANLAVYAVFTKLVFLPVVRLFVYRNSDAWRQSQLTNFDARIAPSYSYTINTDVGALLERLGNAVRVAADLWFPPQFNLHLIVAAVLLIALVAASAVTIRRLASVPPASRLISLLPQFSVFSWRVGAARSLAVVGVALVLSTLPILASGGGFVTYRTVPAVCAILGVLFLYGVGVIGEAIWRATGSSCRKAVLVGTIAVMLGITVAVAGNFYSNYSIMRLSRNEYSYFKDIVRQAIASKSVGLILIDPRPFSLPEDNPVMYDQKGRPVPPYELGCLSSYCIQTGSILRVAAAEFGWSLPTGYEIQVAKGDVPAAGITCEMIKAPTPTFPPGASARARETIRHYRSLAPFTCVEFKLDWYDLGLDLNASR